MLYFKNNLQDVKDKLNANLYEHTAALEAWQKVKINKKKDGSEFQSIVRATEGASIREYIGHNNGELCVYYKANGRYSSDSILIYGYLDELPETDERRAAYVKSFVRQIYNYTPDEVRAAIDWRIKYLTETIEQDKKNIENAETAYKEFHEAVKTALTKLYDTKIERATNWSSKDSSIRYNDTLADLICAVN